MYMIIPEACPRGPHRRNHTARNSTPTNAMPGDPAVPEENGAQSDRCQRRNRQEHGRDDAFALCVIADSRCGLNCDVRAEEYRRDRVAHGMSEPGEDQHHEAQCRDGGHGVAQAEEARVGDRQISQRAPNGVGQSGHRTSSHRQGRGDLARPAPPHWVSQCEKAWAACPVPALRRPMTSLIAMTSFQARSRLKPSRSTMRSTAMSSAFAGIV